MKKEIEIENRLTRVETILDDIVRNHLHTIKERLDAGAKITIGILVGLIVNLIGLILNLIK